MNLTCALGGAGTQRGWKAPLPPKSTMWQLKEPSKPKCVCAHTQFITAEHMANILTHVSRARKTNRARAARGSGPLRWGCATAPGPRAGRVGPRGREPEPGARSREGQRARPLAARCCSQSARGPQPTTAGATVRPGSSRRQGGTSAAQPRCR